MSYSFTLPQITSANNVGYEQVKQWFLKDPDLLDVLKHTKSGRGGARNYDLKATARLIFMIALRKSGVPLEDAFGLAVGQGPFIYRSGYTLAVACPEDPKRNTVVQANGESFGAIMAEFLEGGLGVVVIDLNQLLFGALQKLGVPHDVIDQQLSILGKH
jgi:hypothetical protein